MKTRVVTSLTGSLALMALAHLIIELSANFMPVLYPLLITNMGLTYTQVGLIALVMGICGSLSQPLFGYLSDRWGAQRLVIGSIVWIGLIMGLIGFAPNYWMLILLVGLGALGSAAFHPAAATLAVSGDSRRRGAAMSLFSVGGNLGTALSPLWIAVGIGWLDLRGTVIVMPVAVLAGFYIYGYLQQQGRAAGNLAEKSQPKFHSNSQPQVGSGILFGLALIIIAVMARSWFQVTLMTYLPEWLENQGRSLTTAGQILSLFLVSVGAGSLSGGTLSDHIGRWQVLGLSLGLLMPAHWLFLATTGYLQIVLVIVMGILIGATFPVSLVMAQDVWPNRVGFASALVMGLGWAPGGIGASITGLVADRFSLTIGLQLLIVPILVGFGTILVYAALKRQVMRPKTEMFEQYQ